MNTSGSGGRSDEFFVTGTLGGVERYAPFISQPPAVGTSTLNALTQSDGASPQWYFYIQFPANTPTTFSCNNMGYYISFLEGNGLQYSGRATGLCEVSFEASGTDVWQGTFTARMLYTGSMTQVDLTDGRFRVPRAR